MRIKLKEHFKSNSLSSTQFLEGIRKVVGLTIILRLQYYNEIYVS